MTDNEQSNDQGLPLLITEALDKWATEAPHQLLVRQLSTGDPNEPESTLTRQQFRDSALALAAALQSRLQGGNRAIVCCASGVDAMLGILACLYAGVVAVPLPTARPGRLAGGLAALEKVALDSGARAVIVSEQEVRTIKPRLLARPSLAGVSVLGVEARDQEPEQFRPTPLHGSDIAYLDYGWGPVREPNALCITHSNIVASLSALKERFELNPKTRFLSCVTAGDTQGLLCAPLVSVYVGGSCTHLPIESFYQRPRRWLEVATRYRATVLPALAHMLQRCVNASTGRSRGDIDLSAVQALPIDSDVDADTLERFAAKYSSRGLDPAALSTGLFSPVVITAQDPKNALRTLRVSTQALDEGYAEPAEGTGTTTLASSGAPLPGQRCAIVQSLKQVPDKSIGEVWFQGTAVPPSSWHERPGFGKALSGTLLNVPGAWAKTLRYAFLHEGQLFMCGRHPHLLRARGGRRHLSDVEHLLTDLHPALTPVSCAVMPIGHFGTDRVALVAELDPGRGGRDLNALLTQIRVASVNELQLVLGQLTLVNPGALYWYRRSDGVIDTKRLERAISEGALKPLAAWAERGAVASTQSPVHALLGETPPGRELLESTIWQVLTKSPVIDAPKEPDPFTAFVELGLDDLHAAELSGPLSDALGRTLHPWVLLEHPTLRALSEHLLSTWQSVSRGTALPQQTGRPSTLSLVPLPPLNAVSNYEFISLLPRAGPGGERLPDRNALTYLEQGEQHSAILHCLRKLLADELPGDTAETVSEDRTLYSLGLDSLAVLRLTHRLSSELDRTFPDSWVFENPTLSKLASSLAHELGQDPSQSLDTVTRALHRLVDEEPQKTAFVDSVLNLLARGGVAPEDTLQYPLSPGQERLWVLERAGAATGLYNVYLPLEVHGEFDLHLARRAVNVLGERHDVLRSRIVVDDVMPFQEVVAHVDLVAERQDLTHLGGAARAAAEELSRAQSLKPTDTSEPPMLHLSVFKVGERRHLICLVMHQFVTDSWSTALLLTELAETYSALKESREPRLGPRPQSYKQFVERTLQWLDGAEAKLHGEYWQEQLQGASRLALPGDFPKAAAPDHRGGALPFSLSHSTAQSIHELSSRLNVTPYVVFLSAWSLLLSRVASAEDVVVGTLSSGRMDPAFAHTVGFFLNTLPLRTRVTPNQTTEDYISAVSEVLHAALTHQRLPYSEILRASDQTQSGSLDEDPLISTALVLDQSVESYALPGATLTPATRMPYSGTSLGTAKFELKLTLATDPRGYLGELEYASNLFTEETAQRLLNLYQALLEEILAGPRLPIEEHRLQLAEDVECVQAWNHTQVPSRPTLTLTELCEAQQSHTPLATAVVFQGTSLSYAALHAKANRLARHLHTLGVGPEVRVGVSLRRGLELPVALLAVLKAGGVYVPLDPEYPRDRLLFMAADAQVSVLLSSVHTPNPGWPETLPRVDLDALPPSVQALEDTPPACTLSLDNLAFIIYTSGSTGKPKGVGTPHRAASRLVAKGLLNDVGEGDVFLQFAPVAFDASTLEIWGALTRGAALAIMPPGLPALGELAAFIEDSHVSAMWITAGLFRKLMEAEPQSICGVRHLWTGGDVVPLPQALAAAKACAGTVYNGYGPTETTTFATTYAVTPETEQLSSLPIGAPIAETSAHVMGPNGNEVPVGMPGELCIGGEGLARGYLGRPDLTAEKFIPNAFGPPGSRAYRSGDLVRWRTDGQLEFLGRADDQVKLRGYRIELGEIEAVLAQSPAVRQCVVLVGEQSPGQKRLIGYVVPSAEELSGDGSELRSFLAERLPHYMCPSAFVMMDAFPLTTNGKVDRKALPQPGFDRTETDVAFVAPRNELEEILSAIWSDVLGVHPIGVHDDFFRLGADSILVLQAVTRAAREGITLSPREVFDSPTVEKLAPTCSLGARDAVLPPIEAIPRDATRLPLSFSQERLWFLDELHPGSALYSLPAQYRFTGDLDAGALGRALEWMVERHEALRTVFRKDEDGNAFQVIRPPETWPGLQTVTNVSEADLGGLLVTFARESFDLSEGPLFRAKLLEISNTERVLLLNMHHIISDGWSMGVLMREMSAAYASFEKSGTPPGIPGLTIQGADFAVWQRHTLVGERLEDDLNYWRNQLRGVEPLELPTDKPRPRVRSDHGAHVPFALSAETSEGLETLVRARNATLFMGLLAGFAELLHRYSGQTDIVVGSPTANRTALETEDLIGFFVNTLAMRLDLSSEPTFGELLGQVRETTLGAHDHQMTPFEKVVEAIDIPREASRTPVFQALLVLQSAPEGELSFGEHVSVTTEYLDTDTSKFDLLVNVIQTSNGIEGHIEYCTALWERSTMVRFSGQLQRLFESALRAPNLPLGELPILGAEEAHDVLVRRNDTGVNYQGPTTIPALFEQRVKEHPNDIAVRFNGATLTYAELNSRANQLAHYLRGLGVNLESRVGVCLGRSLELPIALLGISKAGGAYVPLDPSYPAERLGFMVTDANLPVVVTKSNEPDPGWPAALKRVLLDELSEELSLQPKEAIGGALLHADNLAYIVYTSGSTGRPKAVGTAHRAVVRLAAKGCVSDITSSDVFLQFAPVAFDASTFEFWVCFSAGATLAIAPPGLPSMDELSDFIVTEGVTTLWLTSGLFRRIVEQRPEALTSVKLLFTGGDVVSPTHAVLAAQTSSGKVFNGYGPTEATTFATKSLVRRDADPQAALPIGKPIAETTTFILDPGLLPCPIGVGGELYIGGEGLARGYLGRPEATAERFIPHPFGADGERLYRSGDLARWRADGEIEFLGRADDQVKVRGFRIELGEVETALASHPRVLHAVAMVREDQPGKKQLVGYVVPTGDWGAPLTVDELRAHLLREIPEYMLPTAFSVLPALPLTANGKVDRKALPAPELDRGQLAADYVPPRTPTEQSLALIWSEVLGLDQIGVFDNFFSLGGDSILTIQVVSRATKAGLTLSASDLFAFQTILELAQVAEGEGSKTKIPKLPRNETTTFPLSFSQERLWFLEELRPGSPIYNVPYAAELSGPLDASALASALSWLVERHESLRTVFKKDSRGHTQAPLGKDHWPALSVVEGVKAEDIHARITASARAPFDLLTGPLFRCELFVRGPEDAVVLVNMHHIISDGWSVGVLMRELTQAYRQFTEQGEPPNTPPLPIQYADFAVWQLQELSGARLEAEVEHWNRTLAGLETLELPTDRTRPPVQSDHGAHLPIVLSAQLTASLEELARLHHGTLFMVLLAGVATLFSRYSGQSDVVIGSPVANRPREETENIIGFFVNTFALRCDLQGDPTFEELFERVRHTCLKAYAHDATPFEKVVNSLDIPRDTSRTPVFQTMIALWAPIDAGLSFGPAVQIKPYEAEVPTAKFDWTLQLAQSEAGCVGSIEYCTELWERETMERLRDNLLVLLHAVVKEPGTQLSGLPLLSPAESETLSAWRRVERDWGGAQNLPALVEEQAKAVPTHAAVSFNERTVSYQQLNERANQLAHHLRRLGAGPECRVGVCLPRGADIPIATLGVLKSGAAYVPLDASYPEDRLRYMAEDGALSLLITSPEVRDPGWPSAVRVLHINSPDLSSEPRENPVPGKDRPHIDPQNLAYVIYTSGSTGRPKGVAVTHGSICKVAHWQAHTYDVTPRSRCSQFAAQSFDAAVWETWSTLCAGATLDIVPEDALTDVDLLWSWISERSITNAWVPAPIANEICSRTLKAGSIRPILFSAGGPLNARPKPDAPFRISNLYGPTEATVLVTGGFVGTDPEGVPPTIGAPIHNAELSILSPDLAECPIGVPGELYIGGTLLARGYLNRPDLSADRFVPDPFGKPGSRLYRTGDRVRWDAAGEIEFLGRLDDQVKIRGYRIELGEVESVLTEHPLVKQCAVIVRTTGRGIQQLVAYIVFNSAQPGASESAFIALREHLGSKLPDYMVPALFVDLEVMPLTPSGKVDSKSLPEPRASADAGAEFLGARDELERTLVAILEDVLGLSPIGVSDNFFEVGGDSIRLATYRSRVCAELGVDFRLVELYGNPTVLALAERLRGESEDAKPAAKSRTQASHEPIAIVGMSGAFPGASNIQEHWLNLASGREMISRADERDLDALQIPAAVRADPRFVAANGILENANHFDAGFFQVSPRDALWMDPQQRLFLEHTWTALEDASVDVKSPCGPIGVFASASQTDHAERVTAQLAESGAGSFQARLLTGVEFLPTRTAYTLNLHGPALNVQTACSSSLVAVHLACQALRAGECDVAVAGGASARDDQMEPYLHEEGFILSSDGHCRAFDASADGTVAGNGVGVVVLKRLSEAVSSGDRIHAVIRGSAINNDGDRKVGYTAPSFGGQTEALVAAYEDAQVSPASVGYVECHGTGTKMGDPIEVEALRAAFSQSTAGPESCGLGSRKSNVGHLDAAAGVTSLISTVMGLKAGQRPPTLHFQSLNPEIELTDTPFFINGKLTEWPRLSAPRRGGVSSFGIGGTNAHVVLEEAPEQEAPESGVRSTRPHLLVFSAKSEAALTDYAKRWAERLENVADRELPDLCFTAAMGRSAMSNRCAVVASHAEELRERVRAVAAKELPKGARLGEALPSKARVGFLFTGQGSQWVGMGLRLYQAFPPFKQALDHCAAFSDRTLKTPLLSVIFAEPGSPEAELLDTTEYTQPALFAIQWAASELWRSWGVEPVGVLGHSIGELVGATVAGVFSVEDGMAVAVERGRRMQALPGGGSMASLECDAKRAEKAISSHEGFLSIAAYNGPDNVVISGDSDAVNEVCRNLEEEGVRCRRLRVSHAFHSSHMEPMIEDFTEFVSSLERKTPRFAVASNLTGALESEALTEADYWAHHVRDAVRFSEGLDALLTTDIDILIEVGPHPVLCAMGVAATGGRGNLTWLPTLRRAHAGDAVALESLGSAWVRGAAVDRAAFPAPGQHRMVDAPTYPFQRQEFRLEAPTHDYARSAATSSALKALAKGDPLTQDERGTVSDLLMNVASAIGGEQAGRSAAAESVQQEEASPSDPGERTRSSVEAIVRRVLGASATEDPNRSLFDLGLDSLGAVQLRTGLDDACGIDLSLKDVMSAGNLNGLLDLVAPKSTLDAAVMGQIPRLPKDGPSKIPLSYGQERLWFLDRLKPGSAQYSMPAALRLRGSLDIPALSHAFSWLCERHDSLRTRFRVDEEGHGYQEIVPIDRWSGLEIVEQVEDGSVQGIVQAFYKEPFNLETGPLFRAKLLVVEPDDHVLLFNVHHINTDGWSLGVFMKELCEAYTSFSQKHTPPSVPDLPIQYSDYTVWQRSYLSGQRLEGELSYWKAKLVGAEALAMPTDKPRPPAQSDNGARVSVALDATTAEALEAFGRESGATLYMTLLSVFSLLLSRSSRQSDIVIGSPVANRPGPETEGLIGLFINMVALRVQVAEHETPAQLLAQVRDTCLDAYAHQAAPFEQVVHALELPRDMSRTPLFQAMFVFQNLPDASPTFGDHLEVEDLEQELGTAQFDITLQLFRTQEGIHGNVDYCTDLWNADTMQWFARHFESLAKAITTNPEGALFEHPLLVEDERNLLVEDWNATHRDFHAAPCTLHGLFEAKAASQPNRPALMFEQESLSFAEVNARANQLAHYLIGRGVGPDTLVGVLLERGLSLPIALLGILKAGGAYVPMDPAHPDERLLFVARNARLRLVITQPELKGPEWPGGLERLDLAELSLELAAQPKSDPNRKTSPAQLAYIIYTSGSTGVPKGVAVHHSGPVNACLAQVELLRHTASDRMLQFSSTTFDTSVTQMFAAWSSGAMVRVATDAERTDPALLARGLERDGVTMADLVPPIAGALPEHVTLRTLMVGGDVCDESLPRRFANVPQFFNGYGPTEASIYATYESCDGSPGATPIGKPCANTQVYVVDAQFGLCGIGIPGELCIAGVQLARGYLDQATLTAERFVPNPFGPQGTRLYRTGDLVLFRPDGKLSFLGRIDNQVKIRGYRIELGEVESALLRQAGVAGAAVVARREPSGTNRLVAYIVPDDAEPDVGNLREAMGRDLPSYMIPAAFVFMETFPVTSSGKIDRKALPEPQLDRSQLAPFVPPRTDTECTLARIWSQVLRVAQVGLHDNFFSLGGDSILSIKVITLADREGIKLTPRDLFQHQTVEELARAHEHGEPKLETIARTVLDDDSAETPEDHDVEEFML